MTSGASVPKVVVGLLVLAVALVGCVVIALGFGPSAVTWRDLLDVLFGDADPPTQSILLQVRLPRILLAMLVGAGLSGAGAAFQAVLRNPLADPYILGVSGGAALGAILFVTMAGHPLVEDWLGGLMSGVAGLLDLLFGRQAAAWLAELIRSLGRPLAAFVGGMATLVVLFRLARIRGRTGTTTLLLVGVVLNAFYSAVILFLITAGDPGRFQGVLYFLVGTITSPPLIVLIATALVVIMALLALLVLAHRLNLLAFGEETAGQLGVNVERTIWVVVIGASLATAASVASVGLVGFVGLIVPHAVRSLLGPDHRLLIPAAALGGAAFMILADTAARTLIAPVEMPVGVITALVGGPFFLVLFLRRLRVGS